jgi:predicted XRE-type DNA-binding protein
MKKTLNKISDLIPYKVSDMLRGKCTFFTLEKIFECWREIHQYIDMNNHEEIKLI